MTARCKYSMHTNAQRLIQALSHQLIGGTQHGTAGRNNIVDQYRLMILAQARANEERQGLVAAAVIAGQAGAAFDNKVIPSVIFTDPEIATVGITEDEAKEQGIAIKVGRFNFGANGRALSIGKAEGLVKVVCDASDDSLLGVHMVGPNVTDLIAEAALAMESGLTAEDIALTVHPHPTLNEVFMEACEDVHGLCIHSAG